MPAGRPNKPIALHLVDGTYRKGRHEGKDPEFSALQSLAPPAILTKSGREEWERLAPELLTKGLLTEASQSTFLAYCLNYGRWSDAHALLNKRGLTVRIAGVERPRPQVKIAKDCEELWSKAAIQLGLPPAASAKVKVQDKPPADPLDALKKRKALREKQRRGA